MIHLSNFILQGVANVFINTGCPKNFLQCSMLISQHITIFCILGLYQKIDPKVRAERRKKFFGSG